MLGKYFLPGLLIEKKALSSSVADPDPFHFILVIFYIDHSNKFDWRNQAQTQQ